MASLNYPYDEISENTVLGVCLLDSKNASEILATLSEDDFYFDNRKNSLIFRAMKMLYDSGTAIDITTVANQLNNTKDLSRVGGVDYLVNLAKCVTTFKNVEYYVKNLKDQTLLRNLLQEIDRIRDDYNNKAIKEVNSFVAECEARINKITEQRRVSDFISAKEAARLVGAKIQESHGIEGSITGITTGFSRLDGIINGLNKNELIILAARPSVGKSALALNIAFNAASKTNRPVAIFSLEMPQEQLVERMIASDSKISLKSIKTGFLKDPEWIRIQTACTRLNSLNIYFSDETDLTVAKIKSVCRQLKELNGLDFVVIDYLQLISSDGGRSTVEEVSRISRSLKLMAQELNIPVMALSQLSRAVEKRDDKHPMMADLRDSGSIEQDADIVMFLYRDDYYNKNSTRKGEADLIIAKNRSGQTTEEDGIPLMFNGAFSNFSEKTE